MKIEKGIDINDYGTHGFSWVFLKNMEIGDSILITDEIAKEINTALDSKQASVQMMRALRRFGMKGKSRNVGNGNVRVWRTE